jgi:hypothetical protein
LWKTLREQRPFDLEEYRSRLKKLKYVKPGEIFDSIEKEDFSLETDKLKKSSLTPDLPIPLRICSLINRRHPSRRN